MGDGVGGPALTRRRFIVGASAVVLSPLVPLGEAVVRGAGVVAPTPLPRLSVGYIERSGTRQDLHLFPWRRGGVLDRGVSTPARLLLSGDRSLVGDEAIVTVHGLYPSLPRVPDRTITAIALDADLRANDPTHPLLFYAATLRAGAHSSESQRAAFRIRVGSAATLAFALNVKRGTSRTRSRQVFGVGTGSGLAKLRRGAYVLALGPTTWDTRRSLPPVGSVAWSRIPSFVVTVDRAPR